MKLPAYKQSFLDNNREYLLDYLGSSAYSIAEQALAEAELTETDLDALTKTLRDAFDSIRTFFVKIAGETPPKPLSGIPSYAHEEIKTMLMKMGDSYGFPLAKQYGFLGLYLQDNSSFFPVAPDTIITRLSISYQSDYGEIPAPVSLWGDEKGAYICTAELLPELTLESGIFQGWFADNAFTHKLETGQTSTATILYAKWSGNVKALVSELYLRGIADALRRLTGTTDTYTPAAMVTALRNLKGN